LFDFKFKQLQLKNLDYKQLKNLYWLKKKVAEVVKGKAQIESNTTVKVLLQHHPQALQVFIDRGLLCVGCPAEAFHTLADVAYEYHLDLNQLLQLINKTIEEQTVQVCTSPQKSYGRSPG